MSSRHADSAQNVGEGGTGTGGAGSAAAPPPDPSADHNSANTVIKSGPLFISSKGIGWTSWKKRWFILSRTSLVFFRSDPSAVPQKGSEANLTLGGIDLNNSGSVVVKADKKLLTVLFPDGGRDGRAFTLKAETLDDLYEWKAALENALAQAPNAAAVTGQNGLLKNEPDTKNGSSEQTKDRQPAKSTVIGRPVLLALEEVDGSPSFLEKAMRFIEGDGVRVEGILRQAADVEHVERRIREYEEGKTEFTAEEDAHVIADCIKYIIRELPSYPVPASCCNALLEACRKSAGGDRATRVNAMRVAICETFPEPNRRLLQRILTMMQIVASHKNENLMSPSAVAACMAPLLLRPLMAGDCEIENDFDVGADSSMQLLQAAAAANHAQAICITLLEEYNKIFGEGSISPELYSNSEESGSESEEATEDDDESYDDGTGESDVEIYSDDDLENGSSGTCSESCDSGDYDDEQDLDGSGSGSKSPEVNDGHKSHQKLSSSSLKKSLPRRRGDGQERENVPDRVNNSPAIKFDESAKLQDDSTNRSSVNESNDRNQVAMIQKSKTLAFGPLPSKRHPANWGRASARKNLSMESIDYDLEDENDVHKLEASKADLQNRVAKEVKGNEILQASLDKRNKALHEHRLDLEQEVANLREQLQKERDARTAMEAVLKNPLGPLPNLSSVDEKTKAKIRELAQTESDVANLKQTVDDLGMMLKHEQTHSSASDSGHRKKNTKASSNQHHERSSKGSHMEGAATDHENKANKDSSQNQQSGSHNSTSRSVGMAANSSAHESAVGKHTQGNFKRSTTRGDGGTTNALTKLTTRLNFLKERRSQIASELQNIEKGRGSGQSGVKNLENRIVSAFQSDHNNPERGRW